VKAPFTVLVTDYLIFEEDRRKMRLSEQHWEEKKRKRKKKKKKGIELLAFNETRKAIFCIFLDF